MPPRREGEANKRRLDDCARAVRAKQPVHEEEFPAPTLRLAHRPHLASTVQLIESQAFEGADSRVDGGVSGAKSPPAIPAAVGHLLRQQMFGNGVETVIVILEMGEDAQ